TRSQSGDMAAKGRGLRPQPAGKIDIRRQRIGATGEENPQLLKESLFAFSFVIPRELFKTIPNECLRPGPLENPIFASHMASVHLCSVKRLRLRDLLLVQWQKFLAASAFESMCVIVGARQKILE